MRLNIQILIVAALLASCSGEPESREVGTDMVDIPASLDGETSSKRAKIEFEKSEFDTGKISQGDVFTFTYPFKNVGDAPLIISSVTGSCGCTVMRNYPKGKIMPGEGGEIVVEFDSDNKWGEQTIPINVATNSMPSLTQLVIKTEIIVPDPMKTK